MSVFDNSQYFYFTALTVGLGVTGSREIGGAIEFPSLNTIAFNGSCHGGNMGDEFVSADASIVFGFWNELSSIPGESESVGGSISGEEGKE